MSEAFDILSAALNEAIADAKNPVLKRDFIVKPVLKRDVTAEVPRHPRRVPRRAARKSNQTTTF